MADITPDTQDPGTVAGVATPTLGQKHVRLPFITQSIANNDTYTLSGGGIIHLAAFEPSTATDFVSAVRLFGGTPVAAGEGGDGIGFGVSSGPANGYLHLWITG